MILTFPNLGNVAVLLGVLMREWGVPFVMPSPTTARTVELGARYAPESMCLPMKAVLGNYLEAIEHGADTGLFLGGGGPCLFGCFGESCRLVFSDNNISFDMLIPGSGTGTVSDAFEALSRESGKGYAHFAKSALPGLKCCAKLDRLENKFNDTRVSIEEKNKKSELSHLEDKTQLAMRKAGSFAELSRIIDNANEKCSELCGNKIPEAKISIVGDIYTSIDSSVNMGLQRRLADAGILTRRSMTVTKWFLRQIPCGKLYVRARASGELNRSIGGFALETVGMANAWAKKADGIIQVFPLNCMPETVANTILGGTAEKRKTPTMSLVLDELTSEGGYNTRIEAFTDMIIRRKKQNEALSRR